MYHTTVATIAQLVEANILTNPSDSDDDDNRDLDECDTSGNYVDPVRKANAVKEGFKSILEQVTKKIGFAIYDHDDKNMAQKLELADPYNIFFNKLEHSKQTWTEPNAITFSDLLSPSLGKLTHALYISTACNLHWIMGQYKCFQPEGNVDVTILTQFILNYGNNVQDEDNKNETPDEYEVKFMNSTKVVKLPDQLNGTKLGIHVYEDGSLRVFVFTSSLTYEEWNLVNNIIWVSPLCPNIDTDNPLRNKPDRSTDFKRRLHRFLRYYEVDELKFFLKAIERANFDDIRAHLVTNVPVSKNAPDEHNHFHYIKHVLSNFCKIPASREPWRAIIQTTSIGNISIERDKYAWINEVLTTLMESDMMSAENFTTEEICRLIYPTKKTIVNGFYGKATGYCYNYLKKTHKENSGIHRFLCDWRAEKLQRTRCGSSANTYCRISPNLKGLAYFMLSSASLNQACFGEEFGDMSTVRRDVTSFDAGILLVPKFFEQDRFYIESPLENLKLFPMMYDVTLKPYGALAKPWLPRSANKKATCSMRMC